MEEVRDEKVELELVSTDLVYEGAVWDVRSDTVRYGDGEMTRQYVEHPGAAAVVAIDDDERVVLIQQYRHPIKERDWEIPAGLLDVAGEPPLETAKRELTEEADLAADRWQHLVSMHTTPGGNDEVVHLFLARGLRAVDTDFEREHEESDMRLERVPLTEVIDGVLAGLVAIVPGAAGVSFPWSLIVGVLAGSAAAIVYGSRRLSSGGRAGHWALVVLTSTAIGYLAPAIAGDTIGFVFTGRLGALVPLVAAFASASALGLLASVPSWLLARRARKRNEKTPG